MGHNSDNELFSPIINFYLLIPQICLGGEQKKNKTEELTSWYPPPHRAPEDNVVQSLFSYIMLKFLVCFPQPLVAFWLLSHIFWCYFPI